MSDSVRIKEFKIGRKSPCFIIAEAGVNHNGDIDIAHKLVDAAKLAGADAVKFELLTFHNGNIAEREGGFRDFVESEFVDEGTADIVGIVAVREELVMAFGNHGNLAIEVIVDFVDHSTGHVIVEIGVVMPFHAFHDVGILPVLRTKFVSCRHRQISLLLGPHSFDIDPREDYSPDCVIGFVNVFGFGVDPEVER